VYWTISKGGGGVKRSRGFKPLLRKEILLDFFHFCGINIVLIQSILRFNNYIEFTKLLALKKIFS
jgi:hypothetical protein